MLQRVLLKNAFMLLGALGFFLSSSVMAQDFVSSSFLIRDPVLYPAGYATSSGYSLTSTIGQIVVGTSTAGSGTARDQRAGFLYFPFVNTPTLTAAAGDEQVELSWTSSTGILGWTVSAYDVGQSSASGGPYTYSNVGLVTSHTASGLTNGSAYYFIVRPLDAFGNPIATSNEVFAMPPSFGSSGGGTTLPATKGTLALSGMAYPEGEIGVLLNGTLIETLTANTAGNFEGTITASQGTHQIGFAGKDKAGRSSSLLTISTGVVVGETKEVNGIFLSPTIELDFRTIKKGESLGIIGYAYPDSDVTILISRDSKFISDVTLLRAAVDSSGRYTYRFATGDLEEAAYYVKSRANKGDLSSPLSEPVLFLVSKEKSVKKQGTCRFGDLNDDARVNLVDFSIAVYWYKKPLRPPFLDREATCLNNDGKVDMKDFSFMAYYWTG